MEINAIESDGWATYQEEWITLVFQSLHNDGHNLAKGNVAGQNSTGTELSLLSSKTQGEMERDCCLMGRIVLSTLS